MILFPSRENIKVLLTTVLKKIPATSLMFLLFCERSEQKQISKRRSREREILPPQKKFLEKPLSTTGEDLLIRIVIKFMQHFFPKARLLSFLTRFARFLKIRWFKTFLYQTVNFQTYEKNIMRQSRCKK